MRDLEAKIKALKGEDKPEAHHYDDHHSQAQMAWRMVIELVTGLGIGFGIGYGLDSLLGTKPWLMILFILLGFAAGVNVMIRSARETEWPKRPTVTTPRGAQTKGPENGRRSTQRSSHNRRRHGTWCRCRTRCGRWSGLSPDGPVPGQAAVRPRR